jgi:polysaccharide pyruvyl transferase CsaB
MIPDARERVEAEPRGALPSPASAPADARRPLRVLVQGFYGAGNLGDDVMLTVLLGWLRSQGIQPTVLAENAARVERTFHVPAVQKVPLLGQWGWPANWLDGSAAAVVRRIAAHDALVLGGGDLLRDDRGWKNFFYSMETVLLALALRKPLYLVNVGLGRPRTRYGRWAMRFMLRRARFVLVRDRRSVDVCAEFGGADRCREDRDIGFYLPDLLPPLRPKTAPAAAPQIVVALRAGAEHQSYYPFGAAEVESLARALDIAVTRTGALVRFLPFQGGPQADAALHERVAERMRHRERSELLEWTDDLRSMLDTMQDSHLIVGMRLHACILGLALGRPVVALPYDVKVDEFVSQEPSVRAVRTEVLRDPDRLAELILGSLSQPDATAAPRYRWADSELSQLRLGQPGR